MTPAPAPQVDSSVVQAAVAAPVAPSNPVTAPPATNPIGSPNAFAPGLTSSGQYVAEPWRGSAMIGRNGDPVPTATSPMSGMPAVGNTPRPVAPAGLGFSPASMAVPPVLPSTPRLLPRPPARA